MVKIQDTLRNNSIKSRWYSTKKVVELKKQYEEANKVQWPWAAEKVDFTRAKDKNVDEFGRADSVDRLMTEINNGRMHDVDKLIGDEIIKQETILNLINQIRIKTTMRKSELKILKDDNNNFRLCFAKLSNILFLYKNLFFNGFHSHLILSVK